VCRELNHSRVPFLYQRKPQAPPLRYAPVGMTKERAALDLPRVEVG
jgi:hypothetical protein